MRPNYLFVGYNAHDVVEARKKQVKEAVQRPDPNYLLNVSEEDLVRSLTEEHRLHVPVLKEDEIHVADQGETKVDVSQDHNRWIEDRSQPFYLPGTRMIIAVPFEGDPELLKVQPNTYVTNPPVADIVGNELHLTYTMVEPNAEGIKREYQRTVEEIRKHLDWLASSFNQFHEQLEALVRQEIQKRKARLLANAGMVTSLGLPIRRREDAPTTYAVPVSRRKPRIERPQATTAPFQPEPTLAIEEYEHILAIMKNMVAVMERSPTAFETMGEEDLRQHFLVQLNAQYEGQATAETFNFQGKTDILLRWEGKNVFIAECKFWRGERALLDTIDQLLGYLSWRDTKVAVVVFNRKADFGGVLAKIAEAVPRHRCFKRDLGKSDDSTFRYVFHQPGDPNREVWLTVMAFDVPTGLRESKATRS